jgi:hypothetical protein
MDSPDYTLNQGQRAAADAFFEFLFDDASKEFIISGKAGVGKTHLMGYIIDNTMLRYDEMCRLIGMQPLYRTVHMTATTNKAAEQLSRATHKNTQTIHSFLNLKVTEDFETGVSKLTKVPNAWKVHENIILFIDECSMIDKQLYAHLQEGTHNCKIVYVGDHNQLAPVMEDVSPIYRQNAPFFELTEPMRNNNQPALIAVCQQLRATVETGIFQPIQIVPGVIDLLSDSEMDSAVTSHFMAQNPEERILAYSNKRVMQFNDHIRVIRGLTGNFTAGELLVNNSTIKVGSRATTLNVETGITVVRNLGPDKAKITDDVDIDIDRLDIKTDLGDFYSEVPVPTDRTHINALLKHFKSIKNWERFYYVKGFADFRARDAATVHKSQGSTYDAVFIDLTNISTCTQIDQTARMLYVAFSRAKTRVFLWGDLAPKYGGIIK